MPSPATTALADQLAAASAHAHRVLAHGATTHNQPIVTTTATPPWLRDQINRLTAALTNGTARTCPHLTGGPQIIISGVWAPGLIVCTDCRPLLTPHHTEDTTCDRCRTQHPTLHPCMAAIGPLLLAYGLCGPCLTHVDPTHPTTTHITRKDRRK